MVTSHISRIHHPNLESDSGIILSTIKYYLIWILFIFTCVCVCVCIDLWNFIKWISPCNHHSQGIELFHWHKEIPSLPFPATPWTLITCDHSFVFHHNNFDILRTIYKQWLYLFIFYSSLWLCLFSVFKVSRNLLLYFILFPVTTTPPHHVQHHSPAWVMYRIVGGDFPDGPVVKNLPANAEDMGSIPGPEMFHMLWGNKARTP